MPKFFASNISGDRIVIDSEDVAHIKKVLRLDVGDVIAVCDGMGFDYEAEIAEISDGAVACRVLQKTAAETEANISVTLFQALPKATKMDYIIQKTTELGIFSLVPCVLKRCVVKLDKEKAEEKKTARWQKIAYEAAKQSGRGVIPKVHMPVSFSDALDRLQEADICFVPYEEEQERSLRSVLTSVPEPKTVAFMIGPEGGFDPSEVEQIRKRGIPTVTLGKRILRTETAGEAVLSMVMYEIGDINR